MRTRCLRPAPESSGAERKAPGATLFGVAEDGLIRIDVRPRVRTFLVLGGAVALPLLLVLSLQASPPAACAVAVLVSLLSVALAAPHLRATIELDGDSISIRHPFHGFADRLDNLEPVASSKFDFRQDRQRGLKRLFRGVHLRGFHMGWFVLRNDAVAYVCLSRRQRARLFEGRDGYCLVLDPGTARRVERHLHRRQRSA